MKTVLYFDNITIWGVNCVIIFSYGYTYNKEHIITNYTTKMKENYLTKHLAKYFDQINIGGWDEMQYKWQL